MNCPQQAFAQPAKGAHVCSSNDRWSGAHGSGGLCHPESAIHDRRSTSLTITSHIAADIKTPFISYFSSFLIGREAAKTPAVGATAGVFVFPLAQGPTANLLVD